MEKSVYKEIENVGNNWWFISREQFVISVLKKMKENFRLLEGGFGTGRLIEMISKKYNSCKIFGIDSSEDALLLAKGKNIKCKLIRGDLTKMKFKNYFDVVTCLDVLEHVDDNLALKEIWNALKPNGLLILTVPAFNILWCKNDDLSHHKRRYTTEKLEKNLIKNGFSIELISYWNFGMLLPILIIRKINKLLDKLHIKKEPTYDLFTPMYFLNKLLIFLLLFENKLLLNKFKFPFGTSVFCVAKKV